MTARCPGNRKLAGHRRPCYMGPREVISVACLRSGYGLCSRSTVSSLPERTPSLREDPTPMPLPRFGGRFEILEPVRRCPGVEGLRRIGSRHPRLGAIPDGHAPAYQEQPTRGRRLDGGVLGRLQLWPCPPALPPLARKRRRHAASPATSSTNSTAVCNTTRHLTRPRHFRCRCATRPSDTAVPNLDDPGSGRQVR